MYQIGIVSWGEGVREGRQVRVLHQSIKGASLDQKTHRVNIESFHSAVIISMKVYEFLSYHLLGYGVHHTFTESYFHLPSKSWGLVFKTLIKVVFSFGKKYAYNFVY